MPIVENFALRWRPHFLRYRLEILQAHAPWRNLVALLKMVGQGAPWGFLFHFFVFLLLIFKRGWKPHFLRYRGEIFTIATVEGSKIFRGQNLKNLGGGPQPP